MRDEPSNIDSPEGHQLIGALRRGILVLLTAPFMLLAPSPTLQCELSGRPGDNPSETA